MENKNNLSLAIQLFFTEHLLKHKNMSENTILSYKDTFRLLILYITEKLKKNTNDLCISDIDSIFVMSFLDYLEEKRKISIRTRNQRLACICTFFKYLLFRHPDKNELITQVLAIPIKKMNKRIVNFLENEELLAILNVPDRTTWHGQRDLMILKTLSRTGLRVSELLSLRWSNIIFSKNAFLDCLGKGRKQRLIPLCNDLKKELLQWKKITNADEQNFLFTTARNIQLSVDSVQFLICKYKKIAEKECSSLKQKRVSPHVFRHTMAVQLLRADVGRPVISLWLGHESYDSTQIYLEADIFVKQKVLNALNKNEKSQTFKKNTNDNLLNFLKN